ncbi:MAG: hypothetical protein AAF821_15740 [Cyanobacteria bacterium P01_D01_bin.156]
MPSSIFIRNHTCKQYYLNIRRVSFRCLMLASALSIAMSDVAISCPALVADKSSESYSIYPHMVGFNNNQTAINRPWSRPYNNRLFQSVSPANIRYPGGTVSTYWDYANDRFFNTLKEHFVLQWVRHPIKKQALNPIEEMGMLQSRMGNDFGIVFVANLTTDQSIPAPKPLSSTWHNELDQRINVFIEALKRAENSGAAIRYVELGNEYYFGKGTEPYISGLSKIQCFRKCPGVFPGDGRHYAIAANIAAKKIKDAFPNVRVAAIAADATERHSKRRRKWNDVVVSLYDRSVIDALSVHYYHSPPEGINMSDPDVISDILKEWNDTWKVTQRGSQNVSTMPISRSHQWDVWYTEYGAFITDPRRTQWAYGLYLSNKLDHWLNETNIKMSNLHQWKTSILESRDDVKVNAKAISLWAKASKGMNTATSLEIPNTPLLKSQQKGIVGWAFSKNRDVKTNVLFVNYTGDAHEIGLSFMEHNDKLYQYTVYGAPTDTTDTVKTLSQQVSNGEYTLPPFSITVLSKDKVSDL